ncbi:unnamed protein product [Protopolystoma xenopodis]|uniref:Uncharacterized protein n=1 Tax=Protopolystoma xenopodis TaxID=117903 RepID=A0A3S5A2T3_9PLAT|nr:unnamed protein product [Protopolystoma xenopodis]
MLDSLRPLPSVSALRPGSASPRKQSSSPIIRTFERSSDKWPSSSGPNSQFPAVGGCASSSFGCESSILGPHPSPKTFDTNFQWPLNSMGSDTAIGTMGEERKLGCSNSREVEVETDVEPEIVLTENDREGRSQQMDQLLKTQHKVEETMIELEATGHNNKEEQQDKRFVYTHFFMFKYV